MKKNIIKYCFILFFSISHLFLHAQKQKKIDSLLRDIEICKTDTSKIKSFAALSYATVSVNPDTALYFAKAGLSLASKINYKYGIMICYNRIGTVHSNQSEYDTALVYFNKSMQLAEEIKDKENIAILYLNIGNVYAFQGQYDIAIDYFLKSKKISDQTGNKIHLYLCLVNLGNLHYYQRNFEKSLEYYFKALKLAQERKYSLDISDCYTNISIAFSELLKTDTALYYSLKSLQIIENTGDKIRLTTVYNLLGALYRDKKNYDKTLEFYNKSLELAKEIDDKNTIAMVIGNICALHISIAVNVAKTKQDQDKHYREAVKYGLESFKVAKEINAIPLMNSTSDFLKEAYKELGNSEKALEYAEIFIATRDSMFKEEKTNAIAEMETKYQSEKKQLEIDKLAKEKELQASEMKKQRLIILFVVCGLLFVLGFSVVLFRMFIQKKKANKIITEKNEALQIAYEEINTQKEEIIVQRDSIQAQKEIIEEHQKEIEDSINYAKRIQHAVMPDLEFGFWNSEVNSEQVLAFGSFILFKPKDIVSGDFYWATKVNEWLIVTVADCTGHGVPGAFMSMLGVSFLNEIVRKKEIFIAGEVLNHLRDSIIEALQQKGGSEEQKDGMDIALCVINLKNLEMQYAGANNPCWIVTRRQEAEGSTQSSVTLSSHPEPVEGEVEGLSNQPINPSTHQLIELKPDKQPIGIYMNMHSFTNQNYQLQKGDSIYLMSDGFEDQFGGPYRKKFLSKNLKNLLTANSQLPMANQKQILETTITEWVGEGEQIDDISILGLKI